jgi:hypothetical protein
MMCASLARRCRDSGRQGPTDPHLRLALADVGYSTTGLVRPDAVATCDAFDLAVTAKYRQAAERIQVAINGLEDSAMRGRGCGVP